MPSRDKLAELGDAIVKAKERARDVELEHGRVKAALEKLTDKIVDFHAQDDEQGAANASGSARSSRPTAFANRRNGSRAPGGP